MSIILFRDFRLKPQAVAVWMLVLSMVCTAAQATVALDLRSEYEGWFNGISEQVATGLVTGVGLSYTHSQYTLSLAYSGNSARYYDIDSTVRHRLAREDVELLLSRRIAKSWSLFFGARLNKINYRNLDSPLQSFEDDMLGLGGGLGFYQGLSTKLLAYASSSLSVFGSRVRYNADGERLGGKGFGAGMDTGISYLMNKRLSVNLGLKTQTMMMRYEQNRWLNNYLRIGARVLYVF